LAQNETFALLPQITAMIEKKKHAPRDIKLKKKIKISFKDMGINWQLLKISAMPPTNLNNGSLRLYN